MFPARTSSVKSGSSSSNVLHRDHSCAVDISALSAFSKRTPDRARYAFLVPADVIPRAAAIAKNAADCQAEKIHRVALVLVHMTERWACVFAPSDQICHAGFAALYLMVRTQCLYVASRLLSNSCYMRLYGIERG